MKPKGPTGKVKTFYLPPKVIAWIKKRAQDNCRSESAEALYIFTQAMKSGKQDPKI